MYSDIKTILHTSKTSIIVE